MRGIFVPAYPRIAIHAWHLLRDNPPKSPNSYIPREIIGLGEINHPDDHMQYKGAVMQMDYLRFF